MFLCYFVPVCKLKGALPTIGRVQIKVQYIQYDKVVCGNVNV